MKNVGLKFIKRVAVPLVAFSCILFNSGIVSAEASNSTVSTYDSMTESNTVSFEFIKNKAIAEGKGIDMSEYDAIVNSPTSRSATAEDINKKASDFIEAHAVYSVETNSGTNAMTRSADPSCNLTTPGTEGATKLCTIYSYGTQFDWKTMQGDLSTLSGKVFEFAVGQTHPAVGVFMSVLDLFIPDDQLYTYKNTSTTAIHDYVIITKKVYVYRVSTSSWEPMVTSAKRNTNCEVRTVYWKNATQLPTKYKGLGQVTGQAGTYFYDDAKLESMAKNTLSPISYLFSTGTIVNVNPDWKF